MAESPDSSAFMSDFFFFYGKETEDSGTELINLLRPRMTESITIRMKPRTSVAHEFLSAKMKEAYDITKVKIYNILGD